MVKSGFEEVDHTSDKAIKVWAPDLPGLLQQAAIGMYSLIEICPQENSIIKKHMVLNTLDIETLLVSFLSKLLSFLEKDHLLFTEIHSRVDLNKCEILLTGVRIKPARIEIKAVTYHNLKVLTTEHGLETTIVFDV